MSAELALTPDPARTRTPRKFDYLRELELTRRLNEGEEPMQAWLATITSPSCGIMRFRGAPSVDPRTVAKTLGAHLGRMESFGGLSRSLGRRKLMALVDSSVSRLGAIVAGDFGEAKVKTKDGEVVGVGVDASAAGVQVQAATTILKAAGVIAQAEKNVTNIGHVQAGVAFFDQLRGR